MRSRSTKTDVGDDHWVGARMPLGHTLGSSARAEGALNSKGSWKDLGALLEMKEGARLVLYHQRPEKPMVTGYRGINADRWVPGSAWKGLAQCRMTAATPTRHQEGQEEGKLSGNLNIV